MSTSRDIVRAPAHNPNPTNGLKPKGWHSRRHQTRETQDRARAHYMALRSPQAKREMAKEMAIARASRTTADQLALIARRPGKSTREVRRLTFR